MSLRSLLFVPGDSEKKLARSESYGADALILDLEDSVAPSRKPAAREIVHAFLAARPSDRSSELWVRMFDISHLRQAEQVLSRAAAFAQRQGRRG